MSFELKQVSSLEKVFFDRPITENEYKKASMLLGEEFAYQIAYKFKEKAFLNIKISSPLIDNIEVYCVENVPSELSCYKDAEEDENYITHKSGLFPDVLNKFDGKVMATIKTRAIWINIKTDKNTEAGKYPITVTFENDYFKISESKTFEIEVIGIELPEQSLIFTQWFHCDCIGSYYKDEMLSESHWKHIESFVKIASEHGINMLLTPVFTVPLDTAVGGERPTVQLVEVALNNGEYSFEFSKLKRWIDLCRKHGIKYFEISHLFTQWGAKCTPKIMATVNGREEKIFGWEVSATSKEYKEFLGAFLPKLTQFLKNEGVAENTYFHISDEPSFKHLESYKAALEIASPYLEGFKIIDALSDIEVYKMGLVKNPIPDIANITDFFGIDNLWAYYCCAHGKQVSNRFFAMPSARNRIIGIQLYKYDIKGFLQWGYNFYYSQNSLRTINPYQVTDADGSFPSGDAFSVYPGDNGEAVPSLRLKVFLHGLQDMRALQLIEKNVGREEAIRLIEEKGEITFTEYPKESEYILNLREKINQLIKTTFGE